MLHGSVGCREVASVPTVEGKSFTITTDPSSRLIRWVIQLQEFTVQYRKVQCNTVPDSLSRIPNKVKNTNAHIALHADSKMDLPCEWEEIAEAQQNYHALKPLWAEAANVPEMQ